MKDKKYVYHLPIGFLIVEPNIWEKVMKIHLYK